MKHLLTLAFTALICPVGITQVFVHPLASKDGEHCYVYYMNAQKEVMPGAFSYNYKRVARRADKKSPFEVTDYYPSGKVQMRTFMDQPDPVSNLYRDLYVTYFENGDTNEFQAYTGLERDGVYLAFYENGTLKSKGKYHRGKKGGPWIDHYENGQLKDSGAYADNLKTGLWKEFYENGTLKSESYYDQGKWHGDVRKYFDNGQLQSQCTYVEGEIAGMEKGFFENGSTAYEYQYNDGLRTGTWISYLTDGSQAHLMSYDKGVPHGDAFRRNDAGDTVMRGSFTDSTFTGRCIEYGADGNVISERNFKNDRLQEARYFRHDGSLKKHIQSVLNATITRCIDVAGNTVECEDEGKVLPQSMDKSPREQLVQKLEYTGLKDYAPRGVYSFSVNSNGITTDVEVQETANDDYDAAAIKAIGQLKWQAGKMAGTPANFSNEVAIVFVGSNALVRFGRFYFNDSTITRIQDPNSLPDKVFIVEEQPQFEGGEAALFHYLGSTTKYPVVARDANVQGVVYTQFVVQRSGIVSNTSLLRSVHPSLDIEAIRVVEAMPLWKPGIQRDTEVRVYYKLPFRFTLK